MLVVVIVLGLAFAGGIWMTKSGASVGSSGGGTVATANAHHGKVLYKQDCESCHGKDGVGAFNWQYTSRAAPALDSSGHAWHHEDAQLLSMILDKPAPDSKMPEWRGKLTENDARDLLAYIKTLWDPYIVANCQGARHMSCM